MLSNFAFSARQILWTLTFAVQLVLLVVLLGRTRPPLSVVYGQHRDFSLRLLAEVLLAGRMPMLTLQDFPLAGRSGGGGGFVVVAEISWHAFAQPHDCLIIGTLALVAVAAVCWRVGPWPR